MYRDQSGLHGIGWHERIDGPDNPIRTITNGMGTANAEGDEVATDGHIQRRRLVR